MNLELVAEIIEQEGIATAGVDLFAYHMPESVKRGVLLVSPLTGEKIDPELPGYRKGEFQIIVRDTKRKQGVDLARRLMNLLTMGNEIVGEGVQVNYIRPRHEPVVYPTSEGDCLEMSVNYDACYIRT